MRGLGAFFGFKFLNYIFCGGGGGGAAVQKYKNLGGYDHDKIGLVLGLCI